MKCPYPDCSGEVTADEPFCGECGRSLAPTAVAAAKAGMALTGVPPVARLPLGSPGGHPPPVGAPPLPAYLSLPLAPAHAGGVPARPTRLPWLLGGAVGAVLLSLVCGFGTVAWLGANVPLTPTAGAPPAQTFRFTLADLNQANNYKVAQDVHTPGGSKLGGISLNANYSYEQVGSAELIATVELRVNNTVVLELAASNQAEYAASNPKFEVAQAGHTYSATSVEGWAVRATVSALEINDTPQLGQGGVGRQPIFAVLTLDVAVTPASPP